MLIHCSQNTIQIYFVVPSPSQMLLNLRSRPSPLIKLSLVHVICVNASSSISTYPPLVAVQTLDKPTQLYSSIYETRPHKILSFLLCSFYNNHEFSPYIQIHPNKQILCVI